MKLKYKIPFFCWVITLIIILIVVFCPYKTTESFHHPSKGQVRLEVLHHEWTGGVEVIQGQELIDDYKKNNNLRKVISDEVVLAGKTPYQELSCFKEGIPIYRSFVVYGNFEGESDYEGVLIFNVSRWYPLQSDIPLFDTMFWYKHQFILDLIIYIDILLFLTSTVFIIFICTNKFVNTMKRKARKG